MKRITFTTMAGTEIKIDENLLAKEYVEQEARRSFGQDVICTPCVFGNCSCAVGWRVESKEKANIIGYMGLTTGAFGDYPDDFEYGVTVDVPLSANWTRIFNFKVRYIDGVLEISKM